MDQPIIPFTLEDEQQNPMEFSVVGDAGYPVLPPQQTEEKAKKVDYSMGAASPGKQTIMERLNAGEEDILRQSMASAEDASLYRQKLDMISNIAASGVKLSPVQEDIILQMSKAEMKTDPATVIEKKFAERYVQDVISNATSPLIDWNNPEWEKIANETDIATNVIANQQRFQNFYQNASQEYSNGRHIVGKIGDFVAQMVPFVPWWQQERSLANRPGIEGMQGTSMKHNVQYLWMLPDDQRWAEFIKGYNKLKEFNELDALDFARAMVSFPTSDEYIANVISIADYLTLGSFIVKPFTKLAARASERAAKAGEKTVVNSRIHFGEDAAKPAAEPNNPQAIYKNPDPAPQQLEMFLPTEYSGNPRTGAGQVEFRFMNDPEQVRPAQPLPRNKQGQVMGQANRNALIDGSYRDEAGNIVEGVYGIPKRGAAPDVNPATGIYRGDRGRFQKATTHGEQLGFDLQPGAHQGQLDLLGGSMSVKETRQVLADAVRAVEGDVLVPEHVLSANGKVDAAILVDAPKRATAKGPNVQNLSDLKNELPSFGAPYSFTQESKVLGREGSQRLAEAAKFWNPKLLDTFEQMVRGTRLTPEALQTGLREAEAYLRKTYNQFSDSVINIRHTPADMSPENVDKLSLQLGKTDAKPFSSYDEAAVYRGEGAYNIPEARIHRQGDAWYLEVDRYVDETTDTVRNAMWTGKNKSETNWFKMLTNRFLSADTILPTFQSEQRKVATHAMQEIRRMMADMMTEAINPLSKTEKKELNGILKINMDMPRQGVPGKRGDWYQSAAELEQVFLNKYNHLPSEKQIAAYDAFVRAHDFEWLLRNVSSYRDKARQGIQQFLADIGGAKSKWFEGKPLDSMPWTIGRGDQDAGIYVYNSQTKTGQFYYKNDILLDPKLKKEIDDLIATKGHSVVQVFDPRKHPLEGVGKTKLGEDLKEQVNYIITDTFQRKNLDWRQVDYEPGPHVIYKRNWYLATPDIREGRSSKMTFFGDNVFLNVETEAKAKFWADRVEQARILWKEGKEEELNAYLAKNLPYSPAEWKALVDNKVITADVKVRYKQGGHTTLETIPDLKAQFDSGNLIDSTRNVHDLSAVMDKSFLAERDKQLFNVMPGPKPNLVSAEELDPFSSFNRAFGQALNNVWLNDYKITALETWIQNAVRTGVMKPNEKTMAAHPTFFLYNPQWNEKAVDKPALAAAKAEQRAIVNFLGARNELGDAVNYTGQKIQNAVYEHVGEGKLLNTTLELTVDPVSAMRQIAFHPTMGFFNPVQFFVQASSLTHILALSPVHGIPGMAAGTLAHFAYRTPQHIDTYAKIASAFGWRRSDFKEMFELLKSTGLYQVAGETIVRDQVFDPKLFQTKAGQFFLDYGTMFFNAGERQVRLSAFATSYREWKTANRGARLGDRELAEIMNRSDLMSLNMTRASAAAWQSGALSVPTQFWAYNARMMEQMLGGRLTAMEKVRATAMYAAMYGVPIAAGAWVGVWPVYDSFREAAIERGWDVDKNAFTKIFQDGFTQYLQSLTGTESNVASRFGPGNNSQIRDILRGDRTVPEAIFGASGTIAGDFFRTMAPFWHSAASVFGDNGDYPVMPSDFMSFFQNIKTLDTAAKMYGALNYGKWYTKNGGQISDATSVDAALAVLGLTPIKASDAFRSVKALKSMRDSQDPYEKMALEDYRRGLQFLSVGDTASYESYMTRVITAMKLGDFTIEQKQKLYQRAIQQNQDLADSVNQQLYKNAPASRKLDMLKFITRDK